MKQEKIFNIYKMAENYFNLFTTKRKKVNEIQLLSKVRKLRGILKADENFDFKNTLDEELTKKYNL